jgi:hypothetical protein
MLLSARPSSGVAQAPVTEQSPPIARITSSVNLDGMPDESFWRGVKPVGLTMYVPVFGGAPTERTEIRVAHDDQYLYVAGWMFDSEPRRIRVNSLYRDQTNGDDVLGLVVDPYNANDIGLWFWTNPAGIRGDAEIIADGQQAANVTWNTHWDVATRRTDAGWFAEMRIPFSSIGVQAVNDKVELGFTVYRYIARKNERHVFPAISPEFNYTRPSQAHDTELSGVSADRPIYVTPYLLSGVGQTPVFNAATSTYDTDNTWDGEAGLDIKYNLTNHLTFDLTLNTDFAQVEADDQQVNLTRFELFFPEKRQFFQERSGIFDFPTGGSSRLFHSRRIGLQGGNPVRILGGARLVGRAGAWDIGFLNMQTAARAQTPMENFGVFRVRRQILNQYSTAGAMFTTRVGRDGSHHVAYGLDALLRVRENDQLTVRWVQSLDDQVIDSVGLRLPESGRMRVTWNKLGARGLTYAFSGTWSGPDYQPDLGFVTRRDFTDASFSLAYFHYVDGSGPFRRVDPFQLSGSVTLRNSDRSVESANLEHDFDLQWKSGGSLGLDLELHHEDLREPLQFPTESVVPVGRFTFLRFEGNYSTAPGNLLWASFGWGVQRFYDGWRANVRVSPRWNISSHLGFNAQYQFDAVRFPGRDQGFDAHIVRLRTQAAFNTKVSINSFLQISNASEFAAANVRFRYNFREGNDLWVVYNHGWNLDLDRQVPALPSTESRTLLIKYTHTLVH